ncbi:MAG: alpha/beta hydrolase [Chloroflexota bacterium]
MKVTVNGISINYETTGHGPNVVLIHGSPDNLTMWQHQIEALSARYRVTAYDMRGFGQTPFGDIEYRLSTLVDDLRGLIETLQLTRPVVVGYSLGGWVAATFAVTNPELIRALVLTGCSGAMPRPSSELTNRQKKVVELLGKCDIKGLAKDMANWCFSPGFREKNPAEYQRYVNIKASNRLENLARIMGGGRGFPIQLPFEKITCPTLFIAGEYDSAAPVESQRQAHQLTSGSKFVVLPAGHASMLELPEEFNTALLQFLDNLR